MQTPDDALAFSYLRFSAPEQAKGDSVRRQNALRDGWLGRHPGVTLDTSTSLKDAGKSAYTGEHRKNPDRHALAAFLKLVEAGKVPRGSYLIVENLDRLSREHIQPALLLALGLLQAGVRIVQLQPEQVFDDKSDAMHVMMMIMELARGHSESARKSERNGASWAEKVTRARGRQGQPPRKKDGRQADTITSQLPAWVEERGGKPVLIPERAAVVRRMFQLAATGHGVALIVKRLTEEGVPAFGGREPVLDEEGNPVLHDAGRDKGKPKYHAEGGRYGSGVWVRAYVAKVLKDRRALGECQPCGKGRKPSGEVIEGYFPAVVTEDEFNAARAGAAERRQKPGRVGDHVNVFAGLLRNARDGDTFFASSLARSKGGRRILVNSAGGECRAKYESFPAETFERAVLSLLREIDPHEILNGDEGPDESRALGAALEGVRAELAEAAAFMDANGFSPTIGKRVASLEAQQSDLAERLAQAQQKAANPLSATWGEAQTLMGALDAAPDPKDARLRLRSCLRRMADAIWLLIVPRGRDRFCAVQIWFAGGKRERSYLVLHRPPQSNQWGTARKEGGWRARSLADVGIPGADLRDRERAAALADTLGKVNTEVLWKLLEKKAK